MHWNKYILAVRSEDGNLRIINLQTEQILKDVRFRVKILFWKWINERSLALVTATHSYHWDVFGEKTQPVEASVHKERIDEEVGILSIVLFFLRFSD